MVTLSKDSGIVLDFVCVCVCVCVCLCTHTGACTCVWENVHAGVPYVGVYSGLAYGSVCVCVREKQLFFCSLHRVRRRHVTNHIPETEKKKRGLHPFTTAVRRSEWRREGMCIPGARADNALRSDSRINKHYFHQFMWRRQNLHINSM